VKKGVRFSETPIEAPITSKEHIHAEPKPILRHTDHVPRVDRQAVEAMDRRDQTIILPESKGAFKGDIVEHDLLAVLPQRGNGSGQKVSKFKAQRGNK
jgi:hypothetical protein